jgi:hypothetical protein
MLTKIHKYFIAPLSIPNYALDARLNYRNRNERRKAECDEMREKRCELQRLPMIGKLDYGKGGGVGFFRKP